MDVGKLIGVGTQLGLTGKALQQWLEKERERQRESAEKRERRARWHEARSQNTGQALCSPRLLDERELLPGDTWCVPRYRGPQSRARSMVAEVPRSQVPAFGPLAGSRAAEQCRAVPSGVRGSGVGRWFLTAVSCAWWCHG
ncbi:hypothetical protein HPB50_016628 [Hyalomma asiaticum]|uniref:Uncharacterized protein n=1 Tax=Hyalomma asiaticum TaxID=266040 RepID=A0ACB7TAJ9_HYAAI|nr:hypothetical protein HPB50_016628 [Hyalomma asiaticum]